MRLTLSVDFKLKGEGSQKKQVSNRGKMVDCRTRGVGGPGVTVPFPRFDLPMGEKQVSINLCYIAWAIKILHLQTFFEVYLQYDSRRESAVLGLERENEIRDYLMNPISTFSVGR